MRDCGSLKDDLRDTFRTIERDALLRVNYKRRYRLWTYELLAKQYGEPDDWRCGGRIRQILMGGAARIWLLEEYRLWWRADRQDHLGLCFTCDQRTGAEWARAMIADRIHRDGIYLDHAMTLATERQPSFRDHFRKIQALAKRLKAVSLRMKELGDDDLLKLLGVGDPEDDE